MGITTEWYNEEKTIIRNLHNGNWDWTDFHQAITQIEEMISEVDHSVAIIVDIRNSSAMPADLPSQIKRLQAFWKNPAIEVAVMVGMSNLVKLFFRVFVQLSPQIKDMLQQANTIEEAEAIIREKQTQS